MIVTRTPMRISFAGGGSDLPAFCEHDQGAVIGTTIDQSMYIAVSDKLDGSVRLGYSRTENVAEVASLEHDIAREALMLFGVTRGIEVVSVADAPAGSGLGSSGAYAVGLVAALLARGGGHDGPQVIADHAVDVELKRCRRASGYQDIYFAAFGGLRYMTFHGDEVHVYPVRCRPGTIQALREHLMLMWLGGAGRDAGAILRDQAANLTPERRAATREMAEIATLMRDALESDDISGMGVMMHEAWCLKRTLARGITDAGINRLYQCARLAGAQGGKLCGAGGGGFLLLYAAPERHDAIRAAVGLRQVPLRFSRDGARVVYRD